MHLLNLRLLENEIVTLEQQFLQAGLHFSTPGEGESHYSDIDPRLSNDHENISTAFVGDLRRLIQ
jgi:hypothetical protein